MGQDGTKKTHRCGRLAVRVPLLMHHGAGDASRASVEAETETCWTVRAGSSAEVESPGGCAKCICGWWIGFPGQAMSPLRGRGVELAGTENRGGKQAQTINASRARGEASS